MRWSLSEENDLRVFILKNRESLLLNLYKNISQGCLLFRRDGNFFVEMSQAVGRSPEQCKSKMQKFEKKVYIDYLNVIPRHFRIFEWLRLKKGIERQKNKRTTSKMKKMIKDFGLIEELERDRLKIVEDIKKGLVRFGGIHFYFFFY